MNRKSHLEQIPLSVFNPILLSVFQPPILKVSPQAGRERYEKVIDSQ